jgi:hypothetical protein
MSCGNAPFANHGLTNQPSPERGGPYSAGMLIVNADDWGRDSETTERTLKCILIGAVSSVSAMVFMEDSERAANIALERRIDAGLHLNCTTPFSSSDVPARLVECQRRLSQHLRRHSLAQVFFHPGLTRCFEFVVAAQREEYLRLYQREPGRIDGHHHMHLCSNILLGKLLPAGVIVRRNFSPEGGRETTANRLYRRVVDRALGRRHPMTDFFFSLPPLAPPSRVRAILSLAKEFTVEVETHPVNPEEYRFLAGGEIFRWAADVPVAPCYMAATGWSVLK